MCSKTILFLFFCYLFVIYIYDIKKMILDSINIIIFYFLMKTYAMSDLNFLNN